ncbi:MAG: MFS transporter, partial [Comamonas sp.]
SVFVFGGLATALMIPVVLWRLPESVDFLLGRRPARALEKLNRLMALMGHAQVSQLPVQRAGEAPQGNTVAALFRNGLARPTLILWGSFFLLMFSVYFSLSWTPKLLVQAGMSTQQGVTGGVLLNLGGIVGGSLFGFLALKAKLKHLVFGCMLLYALFTALFGAASANLGMAFATAVGLGVFLFASMAGLYGLVPATYPAAVRATGMGWAIGIGRIGAIVAPFMAGLLLDGGWSPASLYYVFALPLVAAALAVLATGAAQAQAPAPRIASAH